MASDVLVLACDALASEIRAIYRPIGDDGPRVEALPIEFHARPWLIAPEIQRRAKVARARGVRQILIGYAECGTRGALDRVCQEENLKRLPGIHCFQLYAGESEFEAIQDEDAGTFYLTDYFVRHFDLLVWDAMRLDEPGLLEYVFGNYRRVMHLAQEDSPEFTQAAKLCAQRLKLRYERRLVARTRLAEALVKASRDANADPNSESHR